jgi:hypothetical protein
MTYDGKSAVFTTAKLPFTAVNSSNEPFYDEDVFLMNLDGTPSRRPYHVTLTLAREIALPPGGREYWREVDPEVIRALDTALFSYARWLMDSDTPAWNIVGQKLFQNNGDAYELAPCYSALRGYYGGLKCSTAGLVFVADMSVTCFLNSGELLMLMAEALGYRSIGDFMTLAKKGLNPQQIGAIDKVIKGSKCRLKHLGHTKKIRGLGPIPTHKDSAFDVDGVQMNVAQYYEKAAREKLAYRRKPSHAYYCIILSAVI